MLFVETNIIDGSAYRGDGVHHTFFADYPEKNK